MAAPQWFPVTSPRGEDPSTAMSMTFSGRWFPVTSPRGEDPGAGRNAGTGRGVSSHLPARGGSTRGCSQRSMASCFQSPPREGRIGAFGPRI